MGCLLGRIAGSQDYRATLLNKSAVRAPNFDTIAGVSPLMAQKVTEASCKASTVAARVSAPYANIAHSGGSEADRWLKLAHIGQERRVHVGPILAERGPTAFGQPYPKAVIR